MSVCDGCGLDMSDKVGCTCDKVLFPDDIQLPAIVNNKEDICHNCYAPRGRYHHFGCDMEECPRCGGQLICCGCQSGLGNLPLVQPFSERVT